MNKGTVDKKSPWFHYNTRFLKLYNYAIMEYYKNETELRVKIDLTRKGIINLDNDSHAVQIEPNKFLLVTKHRTFKFRVNTWIT